MTRVSSPLFLALSVALVLTTCFAIKAPAQAPARAARPNVAADETSARESEMRAIIEYYTVDRGSLMRSYPVSISPARQERFRKFYSDALLRIQKLNFDSMSQEGKVDYLLLRNHLEYEMRQLDIRSKQLAEIQSLVPFLKTIIDLEETRRRMEPIDSAKTAAVLTNLKKQIDDTRRAVEAGLRPERGGVPPPEGTEVIRAKKTVAFRAVGALNSLRNNLRNWYTFYNGYDPLFTWWNEEPYKSLDQALTSYAAFLSERVVGLRPEGTQTAGSAANRGTGGGPGGAGLGQNLGQGLGQQPGVQRTVAPARAGDASDIVGDPIGREALLSELQSEMIPYTPEELIAIANKEFAWCENEMKKASRDLGYGDDWKKALEHVKNLYVEPGKQPEMIRDLALEAIKFVDDHDLVTVPQLARDTWRMEMMTPERQLVSPFFLGGEVIQVSFPPTRCRTNRR